MHPLEGYFNEMENQRLAAEAEDSKMKTSNELPFSIEAIEKEGRIKSISEAIEERVFNLTNGIFRNYKDGNRFVLLGEKIIESRKTLDEMDKLLTALWTLDSKKVSDLQP